MLSSSQPPMSRWRESSQNISFPRQREFNPTPLLLSALLLLTLPTPAPAQEPVPTLCQVDLLVFRHTTTSQEQINNILNVPPRPHDNIPAGVGLLAAPTEPAADDNPNDIRAINDDSALSGEAARLTQTKNFELLHRVSWQQPVYDLQNALHVAFVPARRGGLLKGSAKLSFDRYFQLAMTMLYEPGFADLEPTEQDSPESGTVFIHLQEVMTDNQLYYLDHPLLGVLAKITVLETDAPDDTDL